MLSFYFFFLVLFLLFLGKWVVLPENLLRIREIKDLQILIYNPVIGGKRTTRNVGIEFLDGATCISMNVTVKYK